MKYIAFYWIPVVIYCLLIFFQSSYPSLEQTPDIPYIDKLLHAGGYALLGFLFYRALRTTRIRNRHLLLVLLSALLSALYGSSDEVHQHFVIARNADIMDAAADALGSVAGAWGAHLFFGRVAQLREESMH